MRHIHKRTGKTYEIGHIVDRENPNTTYGMTSVMYFDDDETHPLMIGYYFGEYSESNTDFVIDTWLLEQEDKVNTLGGLNKYLYAYRKTNDGHLTNDIIDEIDALDFGLNLMLYNAQNRYYRVISDKMCRHEYFLYLLDLYMNGKIDAKTRASLMALSCNFKED